MEEVIMVDENQYKLIYDNPLTMEQRMQTISDIRRQYGNRMQAMGGTFTQSASVTLQAPANVWISDVNVGGVSDCPCTVPPVCPTITCTPVITCISTGCSGQIEDITVTFSNDGDVNGYVSVLSLNVGAGSPVNYGGTLPISIPASTDGGQTPGTILATFTGIALSRGSNTVNVTYTWS